MRVKIRFIVQTSLEEIPFPSLGPFSLFCFVFLNQKKMANPTLYLSIIDMSITDWIHKEAVYRIGT